MKGMRLEIRSCHEESSKRLPHFAFLRRDGMNAYVWFVRWSQTFTCLTLSYLQTAVFLFSSSFSCSFFSHTHTKKTTEKSSTLLRIRDDRMCGENVALLIYQHVHTS